MRVIQLIPYSVLLTPVFAPIPGNTAPKELPRSFAQLLSANRHDGIQEPSTIVTQPRKSRFFPSEEVDPNEDPATHELIPSFTSSNAITSNEDAFTSVREISATTNRETHYTHDLQSSSHHLSDSNSSTKRKVTPSALNPAASKFVFDPERAMLKTSCTELEQQWLKQKKLLEERIKNWHDDNKYNVNVQTALEFIGVVTNHIRLQNPDNKYLPRNTHTVEVKITSDIASILKLRIRLEALETELGKVRKRLNQEDPTLPSALLESELTRTMNSFYSTTVSLFFKAFEKQRHEYHLLRQRTRLAISAVLSYGSFQRNILNHLSVVIRLLSNEQDVIQHDFIDQCNPHALVAEMDRPLTNDLALAQLNWLLNRKEAFKALESEYRLETPMSTEFGLVNLPFIKDVENDIIKANEQLEISSSGMNQAALRISSATRGAISGYVKAAGTLISCKERVLEARLSGLANKALGIARAGKLILEDQRKYDDLLSKLEIGFRKKGRTAHA